MRRVSAGGVTKSIRVTESIRVTKSIRVTEFLAWTRGQAGAQATVAECRVDGGAAGLVCAHGGALRLRGNELGPHPEVPEGPR